MLDPFIAPIPALANLVKPLAEATNLITLPLHIHEVLLAAVFYHLIDTQLSSRVSSWLFPSIYPQLPRRTKINWNMHVTSLVQSVLVCALGIWVMFVDEERKTMDWRERIYGYTGVVGMIQAFAAGYFIWDLKISLLDLDIFGWGSLIHAISALFVTSIGFRPFANYYGLGFLLYELSTPVLNLHWFFDKLNMTGSRWQLYNGIILLITFFSCRVLWGNYQSYWVYKDLWTAYKNPGIDLSLFPSESSSAATKESVNPVSEIMRFAGDQRLPMWLVYVYVFSNTVLSMLNVFWFSQMVSAVRRRFQPTKAKKVKKEI